MARRVRVSTEYIYLEYMDLHPEQEWLPGHDVYDWIMGIGEELREAARLYCPHDGKNSEARWPRVGTGILLATVYFDSQRTGPESYDLDFGARAPYTMFVHGGTAYQRGRYIYSKMGQANKSTIDAAYAAGHAGKGLRQAQMELGLEEAGYGILPFVGGMWMKLKPGAGFTQAYHMRVRGQKANPFLYKAYRMVYHRHEGLPSDLLHALPIPLSGA